MKPEEYLAEIRNVFQSALSIIELKNADYSGTEDALKNFRIWETLGIPMEKALLVLLANKISRVANLLERPAFVKQESIEDSLIDLCNYAAILVTVMRYKTRTPPPQSQPLASSTQSHPKKP